MEGMEFFIEAPYVDTETEAKTCGVYLIVNRINNKCYIGSSTCVKRRKKEHLSGKGDAILSRAIRKYGRENFTMFLLETCTRDVVRKREGFWMQQFPTQYNVINVNEEGVKEYSEEHKKRLTKHFKDKPLSEEHKEKIRQALLNVPLAKERKEKIRKKAIGRKVSDETRALQSRQRKGRKAWNKNIPQSEETKAKISASLKNRNKK